MLTNIVYLCDVCGHADRIPWLLASYRGPSYTQRHFPSYINYGRPCSGTFRITPRPQPKAP